MREVAEFLRGHPPFDAAADADLLAVAEAAVVEHHPAGATIFAPGIGPVAHLRVIRAGTVSLELDGRVLDQLGPGELFGHASMLSGLPPGFAAASTAIPPELRRDHLRRGGDSRW